MDYAELIQIAKAHIREHPDHRDQVADLVALAKYEIEDGESESNECELAAEDIRCLAE